MKKSPGSRNSRLSSVRALRRGATTLGSHLVRRYDAPESESHPAKSVLERFMLGALKRPEAQAVVRHLLTGCPPCVAVTRRLWRLGDRSPALEILLEEGRP
jgi:hypothetical protein